MKQVDKSKVAVQKALDEAHRSIYNKYRDIFNYFDAPLIGLTPTLKDEIEKNTYSVFGLDNGVPTYGYELAQAVKDGYLVDYLSAETSFKFIEQGCVVDIFTDLTVWTAIRKTIEKVNANAVA